MFSESYPNLKGRMTKEEGVRLKQLLHTFYSKEKASGMLQIGPPWEKKRMLGNGQKKVKKNSKDRPDVLGGGLLTSKVHNKIKKREGHLG